ERKKAEENLNETLMFLDDIVESSYDSIIATDRQGYITRSNKAFQEMLGYTEEEITGRHISEMSPQETGTYESMSGEKIRIEDEFFSSAKEMIAELYENKKVSGWEVYSLTKDRKLVPVEESMVLLYNAADEVTGAVGVIRDITERRKADEERKRLQEQLTHAHKMEAIGTLAGGIAHDFNNILAGILGYAELSIDDTPQDGSVHGFLREIQKSTERASNLVNQILAFSRKNVQEMEPVKITPIIKETIKLLRASLPTTIELRHNITEHAAVVVADPTQIHQIMMNLCTNAAHAMPENSGLIDIGLTLESLNEADLKAYEGRPPGPYLKLSIRDNGSGIDHDIMGRVFDPFFTTKEVGKGTGMGLSVTHGIVESHGGLIKVESQPGEGTTFDVFLPQAQTGAEDVESYSGRIMPGTGHILFVDDEEMLVNIAQRMLSSLGYTVTSANSALEALEVFEKNPARFDLVITDQTMPKMTGHSLAKKIMEIRTDIPVILCSGYSETVTGEDAEKSGIKAFISKPLATVEISKIIHDVLNPQES
ncbi:MAG: response regulator, partial [Deltaproteobacteria bacterium]|nr:response regulator [Deltaproteobacteria bacterium]